MADIRQVSETFWVSPQILADDFPALAAAGFTRIINNRPDGEDPGQMTSQQAETEAARAGMDYVYAPFVGRPTREAIEAVGGAEGKTLAYCRSGTRSVTAWALSQATQGARAPDVIRAAAQAGYDLAALSPVLNQMGAR